MSPVVTLIVYAYSSFVSSYGPGPTLVKMFQDKCKCEVKLVDAGDGGSLVSRLDLEGSKTKADVVIGVDETLLPKIKNKIKWSTKFEMFDSGPFAFVYNSEQIKDPPRNLDDLLDLKWKGKILLQDPRLSTVGLGFLLWVVSEKGDGAWEYFKKLKPQIKTVASSWDLAYGIFKKTPGLIVFSYWTSPAYHIQEEKVTKFKAARFEKGHYVQREYLGVSPFTEKKELAAKFVEFVLSNEAQSEFAKKNFMYPAKKTAALPEAFRQLGVVKELPAINPAPLEDWLRKWREIYSGR